MTLSTPSRSLSSSPSPAAEARVAGLRRSSSPTRPRLKQPALRFSQSARPRHRLSSSTSSPDLTASEPSLGESAMWSDASSDSEQVATPATETHSDLATDFDAHNAAEVDLTKTSGQHASTTLLTQDPRTLSKAVGDGESGPQLISKYCCGGGCCFLNKAPLPVPVSDVYTPLDLPDNAAFRSLNLKLLNLQSDTQLTNLAEYPAAVPVFTSLKPTDLVHESRGDVHPPSFVQPHPPFSVFSAPLFHARELTKPGAEKRTFHFDIDVTDYPEETPGVDFKVGGAVGVQPANESAVVDQIFDHLGVPRFLRDKPVVMKTPKGRWPTVWGEEAEHELVVTRRELLTWCTDIQSYPPTKNLLRVMGDAASDPSERQILLFLSSAEGQAAFCDLRTGPHLSLLQLLEAFPSSKPALGDILACLPQLMPRFYSLSNDPHVSSEREGLAGRRLIEVAVTVHEKNHWDNERRATGVGSGFLERMALQFIEAEKRGEHVDLRVPLFRGLMANPLSKQFSATEGPMMLIGAGVGMAPFRGFILNRLKNANCASKIWLVQGVRDSQVDELYSGELGQYEAQIKKVVQSRVAKRPRRSRLNSDLKPSSSESDITNLRQEAKDRRQARRIIAESEDNATDSDSPDSVEQQLARWKNPDGEDKESKYVQDEVRQQGDIVWDIISNVDGRIFVCGSSKGMGEGVEQALRDVVMKKKGMSADAAATFWKEMATAGKYIAETW